MNEIEEESKDVIEDNYPQHDVDGGSIDTEEIRNGYYAGRGKMEMMRIASAKQG